MSDVSTLEIDGKPIPITDVALCPVTGDVLVLPGKTGQPGIPVAKVERVVKQSRGPREEIEVFVHPDVATKLIW